MAALAVASPAMADKTISEDTVLTEDTDWRDQGVVTIAEGATLDLNGYALKVAAVSGAGSIVDSLAEYDRLDYIQATGTQYIDTGYRHDDTTKVDMRISFDVVVAGSWQAFYGARIDNTGTTRFGIFLNNQNPWFGPQLGEGRVDITTYTVTADTIYDIHLAKKDEECTATPEGGDVVSLGTGTATSNSSLSGNDYLLAMNCYASSAWLARFHTQAKLYSCKIYSGETLERDFVPVRRVSDGEPGLFDRANNVFYGNGGTGEFETGATVSEGGLQVAFSGNGATPDFSALNIGPGVSLVFAGEDALAADLDATAFASVKVASGAVLDLAGHNLTATAVTGEGTITDTVGTALSGYDRLDYIQATGTQYIDTGYRHDDTTIVDMRISFDVVVVSSWQVFYGARDDVNKSDPKNFGIFLHNQNPWFGPQLGAGRVDITTYTVTAGTIYDVHLAKKGEECTATPEGGDVVSLGTGTATSDSSLSGNDYLLAMNRYFNTDSAWHAGFHTQAKLYACKIYSGETLERDFVPVKHGDDIGLLDLANGKFYANAGSGTFTAGNVVQTAPGGELRIAVAEGATVEVSDTALRGALKLVKTGEGTLVMSKASQGYAGGTEVQGGTLESGAASCVFGAEGTQVAVGSAGSVDLNGNANTADYGWTVSVGGTIVNGGAAIADVLAVSGVFSPVATAGGFGVVLQDGAKIDFTKWTGEFPVASPAISFTSGANITVVLEPRTAAISDLAKSRDSDTGEPDGYLLEWSEAPSGVTFTTADAGFRVTPDGSGLCVSRKRGFIITIR